MVNYQLVLDFVYTETPGRKIKNSPIRMSIHSESGTLYLVPNTLGKTPENNTIPEYVLDTIRRLDVYIVENIQSAVKYLQWVGGTVPDYEIEFLLLNKDTSQEEKRSFIEPLLEGKDAGLLSEAGCPVVADPGSELVEMAHQKEISVVPLVGPSSILLALMVSGFNGQQFAFHGYLPIDEQPRRKVLQSLEKASHRKNQTQIFMETPYRNSELIRDVLETCNGATRFCIAAAVTLPEEQVISRKISEWKEKDIKSTDKKPAIFLLYAGK